MGRDQKATFPRPSKIDQETTQNSTFETVCHHFLKIFSVMISNEPQMLICTALVKPFVLCIFGN